MKTPALIAAGATRTGTSHAASGVPNQDSFRYRFLPDRHSIVVAVSDGAGSAQHSHHASRAAVLHAVNAAQERITDGTSMKEALSAGLQAAIAGVRQRAERDGCHEVNFHHTTLILAAWTPDATAAIQVGDGAAIIKTEDGPKMLTIPQQGEYANETYFITMPRATEIAFYNETNLARGLAIFTDGIQGQAIDFARRRPDQRFIAEAIRSAFHDQEDNVGPCTSSSWRKTPAISDRRLRQWLDSHRVAANNRDDSTLVVAAVSPNVH